MKLTTRLSPNASDRPAGVTPSAIVLHACAHPRSAPRDEDVVVGYLCDPTAQVSYHAYGRRSGAEVFLLVPAERKAWACDPAEYPGCVELKHAKKYGRVMPHINGHTLSYCLANRNDGEPFPIAQLRAAAAVCAGWVRRFPAIVGADGALRITTHALTARPLHRKTDPLGLDLPRFHALVRQELARL